MAAKAKKSRKIAHPRIPWANFLEQPFHGRDTEIKTIELTLRGPLDYLLTSQGLLYLKFQWLATETDGQWQKITHLQDSLPPINMADRKPRPQSLDSGLIIIIGTWDNSWFQYTIYPSRKNIRALEAEEA